MSASFLAAAVERSAQSRVHVASSKVALTDSAPERPPCKLPPIGAQQSSSVCSLPPIDQVAPTPTMQPRRSAAEEAAIDEEMNAMFAELGVSRGTDLMGALKPELIVPMPEPTMAVRQPMVGETPTGKAGADH
jgi:hypothetical protein